MIFNRAILNSIVSKCEVWHHTNVIQCGVVATGGYGKVSKIRHEGVALPAEEEFDLHFGEAVGVHGCASANAERVGRPQLELPIVDNGMEVE